MDKNTPKNGKIEKILSSFTALQGAPKPLFVLLIVLYFVTVRFTIYTAGPGGGTMIMIGGHRMPLATFTGVLASVSGMCVIFLVLLFNKTGFSARPTVKTR